MMWINCWEYWINGEEHHNKSGEHQIDGGEHWIHGEEHYNKSGEHQIDGGEHD